MNKKTCLTVLFVLILVFSVGAVQASDVNITDSDTISSDNYNYIQSENNVQTGILESDDSNNLSTDDDNAFLKETAKNKTELTSPTTNVYYKGNFSVTLRDSNSSAPIANRTVSFIINHVDYFAKTDDNGVASVNLKLAPGKYDAVTYFEGDADYESSNRLTTEFNVLATIKASNITKYYKGSTQYSATFFDSSGNVLANTDVTIKVNGKSYTRKTNGNGVASLAIDLVPGTYKVFSTDPITGYRLKTTFKILSTITAGDVRKVVRDSKDFDAQFYKSNGKVLAKTYVKVKIKGKTYKVKTNSKGKISFSLKKLKAGTYNIICYNVDGLSKTYRIDVYKKKISTKLAAKCRTFFKNETKVVKIKLSTGLGDDSNAGKTIKIRFNGVTYYQKTDSNGEIYFELPSLRNGLYIMELEYVGNNYLNPSKVTSLITIVDTSATKLNVKSITRFGYGAKTQFKIAFTAGGVPLAKKTVIFSIGSKKYTTTTNLEGIAALTIDLKIGKYTINCNAKGDSKVKDRSRDCEIEVFKRSPSKFIWKSGRVYKDNLQEFKVKLVDENGRPISGQIVEFTFGSNKYSFTTSSDGIAILRAGAPIGYYKISVKFRANNDYLSTSSSKKVKVELSKFGNGINERNSVRNLKAFLKSSKHCKVGSSKIKALVKYLTRHSSTKVDKARAIFNYVRDNIAYSYYYDSRFGALNTLKYKKGNCVDQSHLLVSMYRTAGMKARYVHGTCVFHGDGAYGHVWVQVAIGKTWVCADAINSQNQLGKIKNWDVDSCKIHKKYSSLPF